MRLTTPAGLSHKILLLVNQSRWSELTSDDLSPRLLCRPLLPSVAICIRFFLQLSIKAAMVTLKFFEAQSHASRLDETSSLLSHH